MNNSSRTLYLICYDISCAKRQYRIRKCLQAYKVGGQKSFFECWLTPADLQKVLRVLSRTINAVEDRVHIFQLDPRNTRDLLGLASLPMTDVFYIV